MKTFLVGLLFFLSYTSSENDYKILWCSEVGEARKDLEKLLKNSGISTDLLLLNQIFERWQKKNHLKDPIAVVKYGNYTYKWPSPGSKKALFYNNSAGVLGTRSAGIPSMDEITCFFQDTVVVADTLRFYTGLAANSHFILKSALGEFEIPFDKKTEELVIIATTLPIVTTGTYQVVNVYLQKDGQRQEIASSMFYLLSSVEKQSLKATLRNRHAELGDCNLFINESLLFLHSFWGAKLCKKSGQYDYAQEEMLRRLTHCTE